MTHRDIYIKFMIGYDKANVTSSYPSLTEYEIATFLDKAYLALIAQKVTGNNSRHIGFEQDLKITEDLGPLITTKRITNINPNPIEYVSNAMSCKKPTDWLYFVSGELKRGEKTWDMQLIDHRMAQNFYTTAYNIPWIKHPVCYIEGDYIYTLYDSINQTSTNGAANLAISYIRMPNKFMIEDNHDQQSGTSGYPVITSSDGYTTEMAIVKRIKETFVLEYEYKQDEEMYIVSSNRSIVDFEDVAGTITFTAERVGEATITIINSKYRKWRYLLYVTVTADGVEEVWNKQIRGDFEIINASNRSGLYYATLESNIRGIQPYEFSISGTDWELYVTLYNYGNNCYIQVKPAATSDHTIILTASTTQIRDDYGNPISVSIPITVRYVQYSQEQERYLLYFDGPDFINNYNNKGTFVASIESNFGNVYTPVFEIVSGLQYATLEQSIANTFDPNSHFWTPIQTSTATLTIKPEAENVQTVVIRVYAQEHPEDENLILEKAIEVLYYEIEPDDPIIPEIETLPDPWVFNSKFYTSPYDKMFTALTLGTGVNNLFPIPFTDYVTAVAQAEARSIQRTAFEEEETIVIPTAKTLTYNGSQQQLVNAGSTTRGSFMYSTNNSTWSSNIPSKKDAATYSVYYKVVLGGDDLYVGESPISVTIQKKSVNIVWSNTTLTYNGSAQTPTATLTGVVSGDTLTVSYIDGSATNVGTYTATVRSVSGNNPNNYKLPTGSNASTTFVIEAAPQVQYNTGNRRFMLVSTGVSSPDVDSWPYTDVVEESGGGPSFFENSGYTITSNSNGTASIKFSSTGIYRCGTSSGTIRYAVYPDGTDLSTKSWPTLSTDEDLITIAVGEQITYRILNGSITEAYVAGGGNGVTVSYTTDQVVITGKIAGIIETVVIDTDLNPDLHSHFPNLEINVLVVSNESYTGVGVQEQRTRYVRNMDYIIITEDTITDISSSDPYILSMNKSAHQVLVMPLEVGTATVTINTANSATPTQITYKFVPYTDRTNRVMLVGDPDDTILFIGDQPTSITVSGDSGAITTEQVGDNVKVHAVSAGVATVNIVGTLGDVVSVKYTIYLDAITGVQDGDNRTLEYGSFEILGFDKPITMCHSYSSHVIDWQQKDNDKLRVIASGEGTAVLMIELNYGEEIRMINYTVTPLLLNPMPSISNTNRTIKIGITDTITVTDGQAVDCYCNCPKDEIGASVMNGTVLVRGNNIGTYTVTVKTLAGSKIDVTYNVQKADEPWIDGSSSRTIYLDTTQETIKIAGGDYITSCQSSDTSILTAEIDSRQNVHVTPVSAGNATVTVHTQGNYDLTVSYSVLQSPIRPHVEIVGADGELPVPTSYYGDRYITVGESEVMTVYDAVIHKFDMTGGTVRTSPSDYIRLTTNSNIATITALSASGYPMIIVYAMTYTPWDGDGTKYGGAIYYVMPYVQLLNGFSRKRPLTSNGINLTTELLAGYAYSTNGVWDDYIVVNIGKTSGTVGSGDSQQRWNVEYPIVAYDGRDVKTVLKERPDGTFGYLCRNSNGYYISEMSEDPVANSAIAEDARRILVRYGWKMETSSTSSPQRLGKNTNISADEHINASPLYSPTIHPSQISPDLLWRRSESPSYTLAFTDANVGVTKKFGDLLNPYGVAVTLRSSNQNVATVASDGTVTTKSVGQTQIIAETNATQTYESQLVYYTLTVH